MNRTSALAMPGCRLVASSFTKTVARSGGSSSVLLLALSSSRPSASAAFARTSSPFSTLTRPLRQQQAAFASPASSSSSNAAAAFADAAVPILKLTPRAVLRLKQLASKAGPASPDSLTALRVSVYEGGCHGLEYRFNLEKNVPLSSLDPEDTVLEQEAGAKVILDSISVEKMRGSILDYIQDLQGEMFSIIHNPLAGASCGCGSSFSPKA